MISLDDQRAGDLETEVGRLTLALQQERERRVMAALWGSRDDRCPYAFSVYGDDDGIVAYGMRFHDGLVIIRGTEPGPLAAYIATTVDDAVEKFRTDGRHLTVVWLSEDVGDLTDAITDDVRDQFRRRAQSDAVRVAVAEAISKVDPVDSSWHDCLNFADAALGALFVDDGPDSP